MSWSTSELRVRLAPLNRFKPSSKIFYWLFQDGTSFMDLSCFCSVLCLLCLCARLFICALGSPAGKGLTSWLSFVVSNYEFVTFLLVSWVRCGTWLYRFLIFAPLLTFSNCGRPWPAAYINFNQNIHQIQVLTKLLCRAQAIFYTLLNNERGTKYRGLTCSAK